VAVRYATVKPLPRGFPRRVATRRRRRRRRRKRRLMAPPKRRIHRTFRHHRNKRNLYSSKSWRRG